MTTEIDVRENVSWTVGGLLLEVRCAGDDRFDVIVRHVGSAPVLWDGTFAARGRTLDDLPADDLSLDVLARMAIDQADRLGRFVYAQDDLRVLLRDFHAALPEAYRA
jgi:hypothetical protein